VGDELGYFEPVPGIYGTANPATDSSPASRAALQEAAFMTNQRIKEGIVTDGYVPPGLGYSSPADMWPDTPGGPGTIARIGWTAQNAGTTPAFYPYSTEDIGTVPDWTSDPNPAAAGSYDMNATVAPYPVDTLNRAPIGQNDGDFFGAMGVPPNPNAVTTDDSTQDEY